jgi:hypothetical protein
MDYVICLCYIIRSEHVANSDSTGRTALNHCLRAVILMKLPYYMRQIRIIADFAPLDLANTWLFSSRLYMPVNETIAQHVTPCTAYAIQSRCGRRHTSGAFAGNCDLRMLTNLRALRTKMYACSNLVAFAKC